MPWALACHAVTIAATLLLPMEFGRLHVALLWGMVLTMSVTGTFTLLIGCCPVLALRLWGGPSGWHRVWTFFLGFLSVLTWTWGMVLLAPAALRRGDRRAAALAAAGGALGFASSWPFHTLLWHETALSTPLGWFLYAGIGLSILLLWLALRRIDGTPCPAQRRAGWLLLAAVPLAVAVLPGWRVPRLAARADALFASILATAGYADANAPFAEALPPVAPDADPVTALDPAGITLGGDDWIAFSTAFRTAGEKTRPLASADLASLDAWFAAHPGFMAAAEAIASPGYRSCLPGATGPGDISGGRDGYLEPRFAGGDSLQWCKALAVRARAACARGDIPAALDDIRRLSAFSGTCSREPMTIGKLIGRFALQDAVRSVLTERLDLWDDASLSVLEDLLGAQARTATDRFAQDVACLAIAFEGTLPMLNETWYRPDLFRTPMHSPRDAKYSRWLVTERLSLAEYNRWTLDTAASIAALSPGPARAAALDAFRTGADARIERLPEVAKTFAPFWPPIFHELVLAPGTDLACLHTAAALARYRRDHGSLPKTLDALVPAYLPTLPLDAATGIPLPYTPASDSTAFLLCPLSPASKPAPIRFFLSPPAG